MFSQTHVFFVEKVLEELSDALVLGSIFPDIAVGLTLDRQESHGRGAALLAHLGYSGELFDFARGNLTHGIAPAGLDFYSDEQFAGFERGYCFEKGRALVAPTVRACNIPLEMGWWKAHNIVEMGIELRISARGPYAAAMRQALANTPLVAAVSAQVARFFGRTEHAFFQRVHNFAHYIDLSRATAASLADKYDLQMFTKHRIRIDTARVADLISQAAELVTDDLDDFFALTAGRVREALRQLDALDPRDGV